MALEYSKIRSYQSYTDEDFSYEELAEIQDAFDELPDEQLRDERENAMVDDMLEELEANATPLERALYKYIGDEFGDADDPCYYITPMADFIQKHFEVTERK